MEQVHAAPIDPYSTTTNTSSLYEVSSNCNAALSCSRPPQSLLTESAPRPSVHRINNSKNPSTYLHDRNERHYTWGAPEPPRDCSHSPTRRVNDILGQIASEVPRHAPGAFDDIPTRCPRITAPADHNGRRKRVPEGWLSPHVTHILKLARSKSGALRMTRQVFAMVPPQRLLQNLRSLLPRQPKRIAPEPSQGCCASHIACFPL